MRKKSHLSLAKLLLKNMKMPDLNEHKKAFYLGSILPDLKPSFITRKHNIDETFGILLEEIRKITVEYDVNKGINGYFARHLGVITHYLADYCTYPHNPEFLGTFNEHMTYEKELKLMMKAYNHQEAARWDREEYGISHSLEEIERFILKTHREYRRAIKAVKIDIQYIHYLCHKVVDAILGFFEWAFHLNMDGSRQKEQFNLLT